jgi:hypothetical protein
MASEPAASSVGYSTQECGRSKSEQQWWELPTRFERPEGQGSSAPPRVVAHEGEKLGSGLGSAGWLTLPAKTLADYGLREGWCGKGGDDH